MVCQSKQCSHWANCDETIYLLTQLHLLYCKIHMAVVMRQTMISIATIFLLLELSQETDSYILSPICNKLNNTCSSPMFASFYELKAHVCPLLQLKVWASPYYCRICWKAKISAKEQISLSAVRQHSALPSSSRSGIFTPASLDADLLLFAGGSGVTPIMSITRTAQYDTPPLEYHIWR